MSGIAGIVRFDGGSIEPGQIERMASAMAHRGPDGIDCCARGSVAFVHCMLRTTPESLEETQPLTNEDQSLVLVMDGRIDNWEELRDKLLTQNARLRTRADPELVLRAYEFWGQDCLDHIDGDFAFVIWDARRREAFCARDRMGANPFYYHWDGRRFAFASELHAILSLPWISEELNEGMLAEIISREENSRDETLWKGIYRLVAARCMLVTSEGTRSREYWTPNLTAEIRYKRLEDYAEHYRSLLFESVRRQSRSHKPLACHVSGGLDSSAVFAVGEQLRRDGRLLSPGLEGYSLHFGDRSAADEIGYARAVGKHLGREIHEIPPSVVPLRWYKNWAYQYRDFPHYPNTVMLLGIYEASQDAGSRAILTGYGGDEWSMGSRYYYADFLENFQILRFCEALFQDCDKYGAKEAFYWSIRFGLFSLLPIKAQNFLKFVRGLTRKNARTNNFLLTSEGRSIMNQRRLHHGSISHRPKRRRHTVALETLYSALRAHARESFNLLSSSAGIESRDPLTNTAMVDFYFQTPEHIRLKANEFRLCHRTATKDIIPEKVRNRDNKAEFSSTFYKYLDDFEKFGDFSLDKYASLWLEPGELTGMLSRAKRPASGTGVLWSLWGILGCALVADRVNSPSEGCVESRLVREIGESE